MSSKKIISYVWPSVVEKGKTALGQNYEVNFENGIKVLNSENTNYSFGSLHQIMLKAIEEVLRTKKPENILMLGLGAGSAVSILKQKCRHQYKLTAVEIDADLIRLAKEHFELDPAALSLINADARDAVRSLPAGQFDLIIDDVFWDDKVPEFCKSSDYISSNKSLLKNGGVYLRNIMKEEGANHLDYEKTLEQVFGSFYSVTHKTYGNKIYFCNL